MFKCLFVLGHSKAWLFYNRFTVFKKCSQSLEKLLLFFFQIFQGYFTVQLSRLFVLLSSSSFCIISKLLSLVKNFFKLFFAVLFDIFLSRSRQLVYIIISSVTCQHLFLYFFIFLFSYLYTAAQPTIYQPKYDQSFKESDQDSQRTVHPAQYRNMIDNTQ